MTITAPKIQSKTDFNDAPYLKINSKKVRCDADKKQVQENLTAAPGGSKRKLRRLKVNSLVATQQNP